MKAHVTIAWKLWHKSRLINLNNKGNLTKNHFLWNIISGNFTSFELSYLDLVINPPIL